MTTKYIRMETTIQLNRLLIESLEKIREYPEQTYEELIEKMAEKLRTCQENPSDDFLHKVQQEKMKELWDNKEDEEWENV